MSWRFIWFAVPFVLVAAGPAGAGEPTDCSSRERGRYDWSDNEQPGSLSACVQAADFAAEAGKCVPRSAFLGRTPDGWNCLNLNASAVLCDEGGSPFNMTVFLSTDNVSLDCNGQTIEHSLLPGDPGSAPPGALRRRNERAFRAPYSYSIANVAVRRCNIRHTGRWAVDLHRFFRGAEVEAEPRVGHANLTFEDIHIEAAKQNAIFVGQASSNVTLRNIVIDKSHAGVYIEAESTGTLISQVQVLNSTNGAGILIDSSSHNVVEHSRFRGNGDAIRLYKNCGEVSGQVCPIRRERAASHNVIRFNEFDGDDVRVAYRQNKFYGPGWCADLPFFGFWRDQARHNLIHDNRFLNGAGLIVNDAPNTVSGNQFPAGGLD